MNVTCPNCATVYRVDPAKVPEAGVRARCNVCSAVFAVQREGGGTPVQPAPQPLAPVAQQPQPRPAPARPEVPRPEPVRPEPPRPEPPRPPQPRPEAPRAAVPGAMPRPAATPGPAGPAGPPRPAAPQRPVSPASPAAPASGPPPPAAPSAPVAPRPSMPPPSPAAPAAPRPAAPAAGPPGGGPRPAPAGGGRPANPFLSQDPALKARRLARALISDMVVYHPGKRQEGLRDGNLKELFEEEIKKSWEEYAEQVGREVAESTAYFREALNEILAGGRPIF
jgi:predicted Zn finger-like uncharacterized protein